MTEMIERRRSPRAELRSHEICRLELRHRVQVLDVSQSGALLGCDAAVPVGTTGQFRAGLAALPFCAELAVRRHQPRATGQHAGVGTQFAAIDDRSRNNLDQFLSRAKA